MRNSRSEITTDRLLLRPLKSTDLDVFANMHADPTVMDDLGGPISRDESKLKLSRYISNFQEHGYSRFCVEDANGQFVGYVGICPRRDNHVIGKHNEIGWRLVVDAWGHGFATEAAKACLSNYFSKGRKDEVVSYTSPENLRSQSVMNRIGLDRDPSRDFFWPNPNGSELQMLFWATESKSER